MVMDQAMERRAGPGGRGIRLAGRGRPALHYKKGRDSWSRALVIYTLHHNFSPVQLSRVSVHLAAAVPVQPRPFVMPVNTLLAALRSWL
jgi:hypothetical protein